MSGPVTPADAPTEAADAADAAGSEVEPRTVEVHESRVSDVGGIAVRRALPRRHHRAVGPWCFADHFGPLAVSEDGGMEIGPHPHTGLQTVTWLVAGEILHRDSVGSEQVVRAGQLNLMTAGHGVSHSEEPTGRYRGDLHGVQLWVAQPEATRHDPPAFEHHADLPVVDLDQGSATVVVGTFAAAGSPARCDTEHVAVDLDLGAGTRVLPIRPDFESALVVLDGTVEADGVPVVPGRLAYLGIGRPDLTLRSPGAARVLLLGGVPLGDELVMWWNFVARTRDEVDAAIASWNDDDGRFGRVASPLPRIPSPRPIWPTR